MKFSSTDKTIQALLSSGFYKVPRFQRPYSWTPAELEEFWSDVLVEGEPGYFIGSIVTFKDGDVEFGIVDGQQRLITVTILLCCIRDAFASQGLTELETGLHQTIIERPDVKNTTRCVLQPEASAEYFYEAIQKRGERDYREAESSEEKSLEAAHKCLKRLIGGAVQGILGDTTITDKKRESLFEQKLEGMRDKLLGLSLISVELEDEDDAYLVFETLNARGKDLRVSDLVKNHLARQLKKKTVTVDRFKNRWEKILLTIDGSGASISVDNFIHHQWLSAHNYTGEKKLFKEIKKIIRKKNASDYLDDLVREVSIYRSIFEPDVANWKREEKAIKESLRALGFFRRAPAFSSLILSLLCRLRDGTLKARHVADACNSVEVFHFQFTAIASQSSSGGISQMYAKHAREVREAESSEDSVRSIRELKEKLRERLPGTDEFDAGFVSLAYSDEHTRDRRLVKYVLGRIASHGLRTRVLDHEQLTIEHLAPQSGSTVAAEAIANIGNLLLVDEELNNRLANKSFKKKKPLLMKANDVWKDEIVQESRTWGKKQIEARASLLAETSRENVWRI